MLRFMFKPLFFLFILCTFPLQGQIFINEVMSSNSSTLADDEGEYSDWIELYNQGGNPVNLNHFSLSDDLNNPAKWLFPDLQIAANSFLLVFASDKNRTPSGNWRLLFDRGDIWQYTLPNTEPPASWKQSGFTGSWSQGPSGFGYSDGDDATTISTTLSIYIRNEFTISHPDDVLDASLIIDYDDAFIAYLNGVEIARANISGTPVRYNQTSDTDREAQIYRGGLPELYPVENVQNLLKSGANVIAIQGHNISTTSSDMSLIPFFAINFREANPVGTEIPDHLQQFIPNQIHTNFKIDADGESIYLTNADAQMIDSVQVPALPPDHSYGRSTDGGQLLGIFDTPTPGASNAGAQPVEYIDPPIIHTAAGFYTNDVNIVISHDDNNAEIRYTLDGSEPTNQSALYNQPFTVTETTVIRARAFLGAKLSQKSITKTFLIDENSPLSVMSLATTPSNFFDYNTGIYEEGPNAEPQPPHYGANYWQDWEKPIHVEFFDRTTGGGFDLDAGVKIFGAWSRAKPQKSLAIYARSIYGENRINYQIFPEKDLHEYKTFILRNSGNDWESTMLRDGFMQRTISNTNIDWQAYRPVVVYLNGEYWGILNIREKINEHYLAANHGVDSDNLDRLEGNGGLIQGDNSDYFTLMDFLSTTNLALEENYAIAEKQIDIPNFIDYFAAQIYYDNQDWPGNNMKYWREAAPASPWRWIMFDTDFGLNLYGDNTNHNTLNFATATNGPSWPNPPWSTLFLRSLLQNTTFKHTFINRLADFMISHFLPQNMNATLTQMAGTIEDEIGRHNLRWPGSANNWNQRVETIRQFINGRPTAMRNHIRNKFGISGNFNLIVNNNNPEAGSVRVNTIPITSSGWTGVYFKNIPVKLVAFPKPGYKFNRWSGNYSGTETVVEITTSQNFQVTAEFSQLTTEPLPIVISEINYHAKPEADSEDWIELYNPNEFVINVGSWRVGDSDPEHHFYIPENTIMQAGEFLVITRNQNSFAAIYQSTNNVGDMDFGLSSSGDAVFLYDHQGVLIDSVRFDDNAPWPVEADGQGHSLELISLDADNAIPASWRASLAPGGTPGWANGSTAVAETDNEVPHAFALFRNYPNPFNAGTKIAYNLSEQSQVQLKIFNAIGQEVAVLVNGFEQAGAHEIVWQANTRNGLASGIYLIVLDISSHGNHHRMTQKALYLK